MNRADFSDCGTYRYRLTRRWRARPASTLAWIMLNPSTADAVVDDPTIRRCIGFSRSWGFDAMVVLNLFAYRATDPSSLPADKQRAVGPDNDAWIRRHAAGRSLVCAWGCGGDLHSRGEEVIAALGRRDGGDLLCLGVTKDGHPRHPLYVAAHTKPVPLPIRPLRV